MTRTPQYPESLEKLMELLRTLPGIGRRAAERAALTMLHWDAEKQQTLGQLIAALDQTVGFCPECGAISAKDTLCPICADPTRDHSLLCVVEEPQQIFAVEKSGIYRGLYHVLGGKLSPLSGSNGEELATGSLLQRAGNPECREVILALGADVEGRATAIFLAGLLKNSNVKITRPALGLPAGAGIGYADAATISAAFDGRRDL